MSVLSATAPPYLYGKVRVSTATQAILLAPLYNFISIDALFTALSDFYIFCALQLVEMPWTIKGCIGSPQK